MSKASHVVSRALGPIQLRKRANAFGNVSAWSWVIDVSSVQNELSRGNATGRTSASSSSTTSRSAPSRTAPITIVSIRDRTHAASRQLASRSITTSSTPADPTIRRASGRRVPAGLGGWRGCGWVLPGDPTG